MRLHLRLFVACLLGLLLPVLLFSIPAAAQDAGDAALPPLAPAAAEATSFTQLVAGSNYTCGLTAAGGVKCWGDNWFGQLGDGTWLNRSVPTDVVGLASGVTAIAANAGGNTTCALLADKTVRCWGANFDGQLGNGATEHSNIPVAVQGLSNVEAIGAGESHMCAVLAGGALRCWGANNGGQLGDGSTTSRSTPVAVQGLGGQVIQVAGGRSHTCAILQGGAVQCWGDNADGQLGNGQRGVSSLTPVNVAGLTGAAAQLAGEYNSTCAVLQSGAVACWGWLGNQTAQVIPNWESGIRSVAVGGLFNYCTISTAGVVSCAGGFNEAGQLGNGKTEPHFSPQPVVGITGSATQVVMGSSHGCAVAGGQAYCWGSNRYGQLGVGQGTQRPIPLNTVGGPWVQVSAGSLHTCGVTTGGAAMCWGDSYRGQLGNNTDTYSSAPVAVQGLGSGIYQVSAGSEHTCALGAGGVQCWGYNRSGQLGSGSSQFQILTPVAVSGLASGVKAVAAGGYFTCALLDAGTVKCWGDNGSGQLGNGGGSDRNTPVDVTGLPGAVVELSAGQSHACARLAAGQVYCWGGNYGGEIGDGTSGNERPTPTLVQSLGQAVAISAGDFMTCAALATGGVKCWGALDRQAQEDQPLPVDIPGLDNVVAVSAGNLYACALEAGGGVQCFGRNDGGQLGDGTFTDRQTVSYTLGLAAGVDKLDAGGSHVCAQLEGGGLRCWGEDGDGQLGVGVQARFYTATPVADGVRQEVFVNYREGKVGSQFTVTGFGFTPGGSVQLLANGAALGDPLPVTAAGSFVAVLDTDAADEGYYLLRAQPAQSATAAAQRAAGEAVILLDNRLAQRWPEGGGVAERVVPAGIAVDMKFLYLPLQRK